MPSYASASMFNVPIVECSRKPNHVHQMDRNMHGRIRLTFNECNNLADRATDLAQSIADILGSTGNCWDSAGGNLGETL